MEDIPEEISADEAYDLGFKHGLQPEATFKPKFSSGSSQYNKYEAGFFQAKRQYSAPRNYKSFEATNFASLSYRQRALLKQPYEGEAVEFPKKNSYKLAKDGG